jgi:hypothetical protein
MIAAIVITSCAITSCTASRAGWGKGRFVVVHESPSLQVRRSTIRADETTRDVVLNWIGARAPDGQPQLAELTITVYDDVNKDARVQPGEVRFQRRASETSTKILFSDVRLPCGDPFASPTVLVESRTAGGETRSDSFAFRPDT